MIGAADAPDLPGAVDVLALVRRFEPVLRFTAGELFFPMAAGDYLAEAALWMSGRNGRGPATLLVDHGQLDPDRLADAAREHSDASLYLRYASHALRGAELRAWRRRADRPTFHGVSRLAAVGLIGRVIDSGMRMSLLLRGRVPGGLAAAAERRYTATAPPYAYHAHVGSDGGYVTIQYWYLYAMNDWRGTFGGVNDHESDWEQVTMFLSPTGSGYEPAWVAFSSHDETGDELRRRPDDPDIDWVDGTHPVVHAGAGSHSGAYLPGDYLVRVQPPALDRLFAFGTSVRSLLFPWTRNQPRLGLGIPYVDYRRGDGLAIGPGTDHPWMPILIDSTTPWVRDYRGLWGLDTEDPFGGERAPAGPRFERGGAIRASWADPVGWAGLDKVPPTPSADADAEVSRVAELDATVDDLNVQIATGQDELRRAATGVAALPPTVTGGRRGDGSAARLIAREAEIAALRARRRDAVNELDQLRHVQGAMRPSSPHAHLRHRAVPDRATSTNALLRFWSGASLSILLLLLGIGFISDSHSVLWIAFLALLGVMAIEALLRHRLPVFLLGLVILAAVIALVWLLFVHLELALGVLALTAAAAIGIANLRNVLANR